MAGLAGELSAAERNALSDMIFRLLVCDSRHEIASYLRRRGIDWRRRSEDESEPSESESEKMGIRLTLANALAEPAIREIRTRRKGVKHGGGGASVMNQAFVINGMACRFKGTGSPTGRLTSTGRLRRPSIGHTRPVAHGTATGVLEQVLTSS